MAHGLKNGRPAPLWSAALAMASLAAASCSLMPGELNLSPLYRHRLDRDGSVLEMDVLWPIVHYERLAGGGTDFRIRPLYRHVTGDDPRGEPVSEHQFLWPFGRVRHDADESLGRLFPIWYRASRVNEENVQESDWYFLFPFFWGGSRADGEEDYFAFFPIYGNMPGFLTYDRFRFLLFPLYVSTEKNDHTNHLLIWPLINLSSDDRPEGAARSTNRFFPLFSHDEYDGRFERTWVLWPFVSWGTNGLDTDDPISYSWIWPLHGQQSSSSVAAWSVLWPFFQKYSQDNDSVHTYRLDLFWPLFRYHESSVDYNLVSWWLWPFYGRTESDRQSSWSIVWPIVWWRRYFDPEGEQAQDWIVPFYWHVHRTRNDGSQDAYTNVWPLLSVASTSDGRGQWRFPSIWPWRAGNAYGVQEAYGWLWTLAEGNDRAPDDTSTALAASLYTTRGRAGTRQTSVPFLFNYESDDDGSVLRLLQFIPIPLGGGSDRQDR